MRPFSIFGGLLTAQNAATGTPCIRFVVSSKSGGTQYNLTSYIKQVYHEERLYADRAMVVLDNSDGVVGSYQIQGWWVEIGYGYYTGINIQEPYGDNAGNEYTYSPRLWIKSIRYRSTGGKAEVVLYLEGAWTYMAEVLAILGTDEPSYLYPYTTETIEAIITQLVQNVMSWTYVVPASYDGLINVLQPALVVNQNQLEFVLDVIYRLILMTSSELRSRSGLMNSVGGVLDWTLKPRIQGVHPQISDSIDYTYNDVTPPAFIDAEGYKNVNIPNQVVLYTNADTEGNWESASWIKKTSNDFASQAVYGTITRLHLASTVTDAGISQLLADALLQRYTMESELCIATIPHNSGLELYDRLSFVDSRSGQTFPFYSLARVGSIIHNYGPGVYNMTVRLGGIDRQPPTELLAWTTELYDRRVAEFLSGLMSGVIAEDKR